MPVDYQSSFRKLKSTTPSPEQLRFATYLDHESESRQRLTKVVPGIVSRNTVLSAMDQSISQERFRELLENLTPEQCILSFSQRDFMDESQEGDWLVEKDTGTLYQTQKFSPHDLQTWKTATAHEDLFHWPYVLSDVSTSGAVVPVQPCYPTVS